MSESGEEVEPKSTSLPFARLLFVASSFTPVLLLWAIRGTSAVPDAVFLPILGALVVLPNLALLLRYRRIRKKRIQRVLIVTRSTDHREYLLVYLLAMLMPLVAGDLSSIRSVAATGALFGLTIFLFWHLGLHYLNIAFALFGFRVWAVVASEGVQGKSVDNQHILISRRKSIPSGLKITTLVFGDGVFIEESDAAKA